MRIVLNQALRGEYGELENVSQRFLDYISFVNSYLDNERLSACFVLLMETKRGLLPKQILAQLGYTASKRVRDFVGRSITNRVAERLYELRPAEFQDVISESERIYTEKGWEPLRVERAAKRYAIKKFIRDYLAWRDQK
jgi:hypothetical protein